jgi:hypothetical protein
MKNLNLLAISLLTFSGCSSPQLSREVASTNTETSCMNIASAILKQNHSDTHTAQALLEPTPGPQIIKTSSGLQIEGNFKTFNEVDDKGELIYFRTEGPTQLGFDGKIIAGQDIKQHPTGFSSPLGSLKSTDKPLEDLSTAELKSLGIEVGREVTIEYRSGVVVKGQLKKIEQRNGKNILFSFENQTTEVTGPNGRLLFERSWGIFDMAIGQNLASSTSSSFVSEAVIQDTYKKIAVWKKWAEKLRAHTRLYDEYNTPVTGAADNAARESKLQKWAAERDRIMLEEPENPVSYKIGTVSNLRMMSDARKSSKEDLETYAKRENFVSINYFAKKGMQRYPGKKDNAGLEVIVQYQDFATKEIHEVRGVIVDDYRTSFNLLDAQGFIHLMHFDYNLAGKLTCWFNPGDEFDVFKIYMRPVKEGLKP